MIRAEAVLILKSFMDNPLFSEEHKAAFSIAIHDIEKFHDWNVNQLVLIPKSKWEQDHAILDVLPVAPKQKIGHWILLDECANSGYYCSNCQKKVVKEGWSATVKKIKFCPNCGAKMVEPQENTDARGRG